MPTPTPLYASPRTYDLLFRGRSDDLRFYADLVGPDARVLEYGVGTGRVAIPLARDGCSVVGVDDAPEMLAVLAARLRDERPDVRRRVTAHRADARALSLGERFPWVLCPFNGIAHHHTRDELAAFFARVREHLAPGGRFAFDAWLPDPALLTGTTLEGIRFRDPDTDEAMTLREDFVYDSYRQLLTTTITVTSVTRPEARDTLRITQRQFFPEETLALLDLHGFDVRWRTHRFTLPPDLSRAAFESTDLELTGELLAYVCVAR